MQQGNSTPLLLLLHSLIPIPDHTSSRVRKEGCSDLLRDFGTRMCPKGIEGENGQVPFHPLESRMNALPLCSTIDLT